MTDRDHHVIALLAENRAATAEQIARAYFPTLNRARRRLLTLTQRAVLVRFRHIHPGPGSLPYIYTLGLLGAAMNAAATGNPLPTQGEITRRVLRLQRSPNLGHQLGITEFLTQLTAAARRTPDATLTKWWPETTAAQACGDIVRPDAYAEWHETSTHGTHTIGFFYEHDTATENLATLLDKIDRYTALATAHISRPVLIELPNPTRETHLHDAITRKHGANGPRAVLIATTTTEHITSGIGPAGPIWWPAGTTGPRHHLAALDIRPTHPLRTAP